MSATQIARYIIGLSWIYSGVFPKLMQIAPLEKVMTASIGLSDEISYLITKAAGVGEVIFGVIFILLYKSRSVVWLNIFALSALLVFVAILQPPLLIEAFNPVTTNIPLIALSVILLRKKHEFSFR